MLHFIDLETLNKTHLKGFRHGGIGAIAIHPLRTFIAIAEIHPDPLIYILEYPSLKVHRILRNGAVAGYSNICFNSKGDKLASVGTDPDYMLTIWNWKQEAVILRSKAFSQDVYRVAFADESDGILVTSGVGHIKFWRMNLTFTGLKLQGYLGKFGATELTDINAFAQLPDGKVLSSTETGNLLLWDGGIIKFELSAKGKKPCHIGRIEIVILTDGEILTSGEDGYIRMWDLEVIDNADITSSAGEPVQTSLGSRIFEMEPLDEILIGKDVKVFLILSRLNRLFVIQ